MTVAMRSDRAVGELIGGERHMRPTVTCRDVKLGDQGHSIHRRAQRGEQERHDIDAYSRGSTYSPQNLRCRS